MTLTHIACIALGFTLGFLTFALVSIGRDPCDRRDDDDDDDTNLCF